MQNRLGAVLDLKSFFLPRNNHWLKRIFLVFAFILFDYLSTLVFCQHPYEEANPFARMFMENLGVQLGLTAFVLVANIPIYVTLSLDSHVIRFTPRITIIAETFVDIAFAWFIAGLHFSGGASWFWNTPSLAPQCVGTLLYLFMTFLLIKPHKPYVNN